MKDQSQIEDMRAAVRGDIERAKQRRTVPALETEPAPAPAPEISEEETRKSSLFSFFRRR